MKRLTVFSVLLLGSLVLSACIGFTGADVSETPEGEIPNTGANQVATTVFNNTSEPALGGESPFNSQTAQPGQIVPTFENGMINEPTYPAVEDEDETAENYGPNFVATSQAFNVTAVPGSGIPPTGGLGGSPTPAVSMPEATQLPSFGVTPAVGGTVIPPTGGQGQPESSIRMTQVMTFNLLDTGGQQLGRVVDLVVDLQGSQVNYLVVEIANQSRTLVPWALVSERSGTEFVFDQTSGSRFQAAPQFTSGSVNFADPNWDSEVRAYWQPGSSSGSSNSSGQSGQAYAIFASQLLRLQIQGSANGSAGNLATATPNTGIVTLGSVRDAILNRQSGQVSYLLISPNNTFINLNNRLIPIPFAALTQQWNGGNLTLTINPNRLQNAPNLDATGLPNIFGSGWDQDFFQFWNDGLFNNTGQGTAQP